MEISTQMSHSLKFTLLFLPLVWIGCGQNAHLTVPASGSKTTAQSNPPANNGNNGSQSTPPERPTPQPPGPAQPAQPVVNVNQIYVGDDVNNGNYNLPIVIQNGKGVPVSAGTPVGLTLDSPDGKVIYFNGVFPAGGDLKKVTPVSQGPNNVQTWTQIQNSIVSGVLKDGSTLVFDKRAWALDVQAESYYYRLFDITNTRVIPAEKRHAAVPLRITITYTNEAGVSSSSSVLLPVRYRYTFDDDSLGPKVSADTADGVSMFPNGTVPSRVIGGLIYASSDAILSTDSACRAPFGVNYNFEFVDTHTVFKSVKLISLYSKGNWYNSPIPAQGTGLVDMAGQIFGGGGATFTEIQAYGGLCNYKVWGVTLANRFTPLEIDGLYVDFVTQNNVEAKAVFGVTVMEAF